MLKNKGGDVFMNIQNQKRMKRIRSLIIICTLSALVFSVSTYAWFIGMRSVQVTSFDVEIAVTDSLILSLNGRDWSETVSIAEDDLTDTYPYEGHTSSWGGAGLIPMSTVGDIDSTVSRLILFEKASFTPTPGGYRVMASRVPNNVVGEPERDGYAVFDLFIKNFTGNEYYTELDERNEEAIYLTIDSEVAVSAAGVAGTGIENSVRVAFAKLVV